MGELKERREVPPDEPGWDAACDYCDARLSDDDDATGTSATVTYKEADDWGYWHRKECEPTIRLLSPAELDAERRYLERLRETEARRQRQRREEGGHGDDDDTGGGDGD